MKAFLSEPRAPGATVTPRCSAAAVQPGNNGGRARGRGRVRQPTSLRAFLGDCRTRRRADGECAIDDGFRTSLPGEVFSRRKGSSPRRRSTGTACRRQLKAFFDRMFCYAAASHPRLRRAVVQAHEGQAHRPCAQLRGDLPHRQRRASCISFRSTAATRIPISSAACTASAMRAAT